MNPVHTCCGGPYIPCYCMSKISECKEVSKEASKIWEYKEVSMEVFKIWEYK